MTLTQTAYLEIEGDSSTGTFELNLGLENTGDLSKSYIMGERGQYIREIINETPGTGDFDADRRTGFWIDGGAGDWQESFTFRTGEEDVQWGDGSGGDGQSNVTTTDASGSGVNWVSRKQILEYWIAKSKSDSGGSTRMHWGEWTDGSISNVDSSGIAAGAFGQPMPLAIRELNISSPQVNSGEVESIEGTITASHVALWGGANAPDWAADAVDAILEAEAVIGDA